MIWSKCSNADQNSFDEKAQQAPFLLADNSIKTSRAALADIALW